MSRLAASLLLATALFASSGCAAVKPWERDLLARPDMAWEPDALEAKRSAHIRYSKEAALPGGGAGGGGCGCN
jgi:hypothetical protein